MIKSLAAKAKRSEKEVQYLWHKAKAIVKAEYNVDENDGAFWGLTTGITKKMLGMKESLSFKQFIEEDFKRDTTKLEVAAKYFKENGSKFLWMLEEYKFIYRGDTSHYVIPGSADIIDVMGTARVSANTSNHYTIIFDNHPEMKDFPKRSKSLICSTSFSKASDYSESYSDPFIVLPTNDSTVGFTGEQDIWNKYITFAGVTMSLPSTNDMFEYLGIKDRSIQDFYDFQEKLRDLASTESLQLHKMLSHNKVIEGSALYKSIVNNFVDMVFEAFSPKNTGFYSKNSSSFSVADMDDQELWVDGHVILLRKDDIHKFKKLVLS